MLLLRWLNNLSVFLLYSSRGLLLPSSTSPVSLPSHPLLPPACLPVLPPPTTPLGFGSKREFVDKLVRERKKVIQIDPGAYQGVYVLGVVAYVKDYYSLDDRDDIVFLGSSAGAYNALAMSFRYADARSRLAYANMTDALISIFDESPSLIQLQNNLQRYMRSEQSDEQFDLHKLHIDVTEYAPPFALHKRIVSGIPSLDDALDMCAASSHIPFITSPRFFFRDIRREEGDKEGEEMMEEVQRLLFDGGLYDLVTRRRRAAPAETPPVDLLLNINHNMWSGGGGGLVADIFNLVRRGKNFRQMYEAGYADSHRNRHVLDAFFLSAIE